MKVQWFPGHMTRAYREMEARLKQVDLIWEMADARLPLASRNPLLEGLCQRKLRLLLLTKADLAMAEATKRWTSYYERMSMPVLALNVAKGQGLKEVLTTSRRLLRQRKGMWQIMVVGIPNVGKSSLINRLSAHGSAATGKLPGVTRSQQWIRVQKDMLLLDTPGMLAPSFARPAVGKALAAIGSVRDAVFSLEQVALFLLTSLRRRCPDALALRYGEDFLSLMRPHWLAHIGAQRGCLRAGGVIDTERAATAVLYDFRRGRLGRVTLEYPRTKDKVHKERE